MRALFTPTVLGEFGLLGDAANAAGFSQVSSAQALGSELVANNEFSTWAATLPSSWNVTASGGSSVSEVAPGGGAGTGAARLQSPTTAVQPRMDQLLTGVSAGDIVEARVLCSAFTGGQADWYSIVTGLGWQISVNAAAEFVTLNTLAQTPAYLFGITTGLDLVIDRVSLRRLTTDPVQSLTPNGEATFLFSIPSPLRGETAEIRFRRQDALNYFAVRCFRNAANTAYTLTLLRVLAGVQTTLIAGQNIGASVAGIRARFNGSTLQMFSSADGTSWTQRGTDVTDTNHAAATGALALRSTGVTFGSFSGVAL